MYIASVTVAPNWEIEIPHEVMKSLNLKPGDRIRFIKNKEGNGFILKKYNHMKRVKGSKTA